MDQRPRRLLDQTRDVLREKGYSIHTERSYVDWIRRFILFHDKRHSREMAAPEIGAFLTHLAMERHIAASTQQQALSALLFLYREVLDQDPGPVTMLPASVIPALQEHLRRVKWLHDDDLSKGGSPLDQP